MVKAAEIRALSRDDDRGGFSCGQPDLDRFFQHYAGQNQFKLHLAVTHVALVKSRVVGFATVAPCSIERATIPNARLKKRLPSYPLPALRLARMGVDVRAQGFGLGQALLRYVLRLAVEQRNRLGCPGVLTDAKPETVRFYERLGFRRLEGVREGLLISEPLPMFLGIETIAAALSEPASV